MLDRPEFQSSYDKLSELDCKTFSTMELRLIHLFRLMSDEDRGRVRRMSEILTMIPDCVRTDEVAG